MTPRAYNYGARRDENEPEIVKALRAIGCEVEQLDLFDLLVLFRGHVHLLEVKMPLGPRGGQKDKMPTEKQQELMDKGWPLKVVRSPNEALRAIGAIKEDRK